MASHVVRTTKQAVTKHKHGFNFWDILLAYDLGMAFYTRITKTEDLAYTFLVGK